MWFEELGGLMSISCHVGVTWRQSSRWKSLMVIVFIYGWFNAGMIIFKKLCKNNPPKICSLCYFLSIQRNLCFFFEQLGSKCRELKDIHFGQCYKISDEGMIVIAKGCLKLQRIYMQENKLVSTCYRPCVACFVLKLCWEIVFCQWFYNLII